MNRRGLLRLLGAAPVAAPVIVREAAASAGVAPVGALIDGGYPVGSSPTPSSISERDWITDWCRRVFTKAWADEERRQARMYQPQRLDPDIASSRSLSLSAALRIQRERDVERRIERERDAAKRRFVELTGLEFLSGDP